MIRSSVSMRYFPDVPSYILNVFHEVLLYFFLYAYMHQDNVYGQ